MARWVKLYGWGTGDILGEPKPMLFQTAHICGVYRAQNDAFTHVLFVNCELRVSETVEEIEMLLGDPHVDGIVLWADGVLYLPPHRVHS